MSIDEKAFEAFMTAYWKNGSTGLGMRKNLEAYEAAKTEQPVRLSSKAEIEQLAVSRIATWLWQKCNPELPQTSENLDLFQSQAKELWRLIRHSPDGDAGCRSARTDLSSKTSTLTMPVESNPRTSRAPTEETCNISELSCAKGTKTAFAAPGVDWDVLQAWSRVQDAMEYYASVSLYSLKSSGVPGGIAKYYEVGYLATNCAGDVKTVDKFMRSTKRESVSRVEINNLLHRMNLDRPDIAALPEGSTISINITTHRQAADIIKGHVPIEISIAFLGSIRQYKAVSIKCKKSLLLLPFFSRGFLQ